MFPYNVTPSPPAVLVPQAGFCLLDSVVGLVPAVPLWLSAAVLIPSAGIADRDTRRGGARRRWKGTELPRPGTARLLCCGSGRGGSRQGSSQAPRSDREAGRSARAEPGGRGGGGEGGAGGGVG